MSQKPLAIGAIWRAAGGVSATIRETPTVFGSVYEIQGTRISANGTKVKLNIKYMGLKDAIEYLETHGYRADVI